MIDTEQQWPAASSEMSKLIREKDWRETSLGSVENWPRNLRSALDICLASRVPVSIFWGNDHLLFYNDAWEKELTGVEHPHALGQPARKVFPELWKTIGKALENVISGTDAAAVDGQLLPPERNSRLGDAWFNFSFNPIPLEGGSIGGVINVATDITVRKQNKELQSEQKKLLEQVASGAPLEECLSALCSAIPRLGKGVRASILLANDGIHLFSGLLLLTFSHRGGWA